MFLMGWRCSSFMKGLNIISKPVTVVDGSSASSSEVCSSTPDFKPMQFPPDRSPLVIVDFLIKYVKGKRYCEIGTRKGDIAKCISHFASSAIAIELKRPEAYCETLKLRGISVICQDFMVLNTDTLPKADVYYWWASYPQNTSNFLIHLKRHLRHAAVAIVGYDPWHAPDMMYLKEHLKQFPVRDQTAVFFNEGDAERQYGAFILIVYEL